MTSRIRFDLTARIELDYGSEIGRGTTIKFYTLEGSVSVDNENLTAEELNAAVSKQLQAWLEQARRLEREHARAHPTTRRVFKLPPRSLPMCRT